MTYCSHDCLAQKPNHLLSRAREGIHSTKHNRPGRQKVFGALKLLLLCFSSVCNHCVCCNITSKVCQLA